MPMAVSTIQSLVAAQGVAGDVVLQPGTVVTARVVQAADNQARISIAGQAMDVVTQVQLQAGQILQLAVSQNADGLQLAMVPQQGAANAGAANAGAVLANELSNTLMTTLAASKADLTAPEAVAVSQAALSAVGKQSSPAALFANLSAAMAKGNLPPKLQQAIAQVLAQRPVLDTQLTGGEMKAAFQSSGLFLESTLASNSAALGAMPDMKAALIVLKQALSTVMPSAAPQASASGAQVSAATATLVPALLSKTAKGDLTVPAPASDNAEPGALPLVAAVAKAVAANAGALPDGKQAAMLAQLLSDDAAPLSPPAARGAPADAPSARLQAPVPPPLRGALPSAQPMASPTLAPDAPLGDTVHHLMADTDAAIARQVLHQVASLPERADAAAMPRSDQAAQRWSFDIPFAMPHGTAVAQFEIARDGGQGSTAEAATKVWRARFSLDVEPAGPVHALVSLTGDKTSVRMWAERASTAQALQAGAGQLGQALSRAQLQVGDIVVKEGAPVPSVPAAAGHFLDRAL